MNKIKNWLFKMITGLNYRTSIIYDHQKFNEWTEVEIKFNTNGKDIDQLSIREEPIRDNEK